MDPPGNGAAYAYVSPQTVKVRRRVKGIFDPALLATHDKCFGVMKYQLDAWLLPTATERQQVMRTTSWIIDSDARQKVTRACIQKLNGTEPDPHTRLREEPTYGRGVKFKHDGTTQLQPVQGLCHTSRHLMHVSSSSPDVVLKDTTCKPRVHLAPCSLYMTKSSPRLVVHPPRSPTRRAVTAPAPAEAMAEPMEEFSAGLGHNHGYLPSWISSRSMETIAMGSPTMRSRAETIALACQTKQFVHDKFQHDKLVSAARTLGAHAAITQIL